MTESLADSREPSGCTMGDLIFLTIGAAIAFSLYSYNLSTLGSQPSGWPLILNFGIELLQKSCVAMIPVILHRRWRFGSPLKPVDYSILLTGLSQLSLTVWRWALLGIVYRLTPKGTVESVNPDAFHAWRVALLFAGMVGVLVILLRRKQRPDWITAVAVAVAWYCLFYSFEQFYQHWINSQLAKLSPAPPPRSIRLLSIIFYQAPMAFLFSLPLAIVLVDLLHSRRRRLWVEWVSIAIVILLPIAARVRTTFTFASDQMPYFISLGLAFAVALIFEARWRRFLEGSPDHHRDEKAQLQVVG